MTTTEATQDINLYDQACARFEAARAAYNEARLALVRAERELDDAEENLRQHESRPGIPLPEYR